jgi:hypothetical protein
MAPFVVPRAPAGTAPGHPPSFSVVVAAYQAAATIGDAIESVRAQTVAPLEILVCDDGSTDDLEAALAPHGDAVRLVRQDHRGAAAARNTLLRSAVGDFVAPLDADDTFAPTRIERLSELAAERPDLDILTTDAVFMVRGRPTGRFHDRVAFPVQGQRRAILGACCLIMPAFRRTRLLVIGGYDESLATAEDWDLLIRLFERGAAAGLVDEPLLEYRLQWSSLTSSRAETLRDRVVVLERARARGALAGDDVEALERSLVRHRARALQQAAHEAVAAWSPDARARLMSLARSSDAGRRTRVVGALAAIAPRPVSRALGRTLTPSSGRPE